jgi:transposase-like protein
MRQASKRIPESAEKTVRDIRRATRRHHSAEEKIRIVLEGLRGEDSIAELCRKEGINQNLYYRWSKEFLEAGKKRLAGDMAREATSDDGTPYASHTAASHARACPLWRGDLSGTIEIAPEPAGHGLPLSKCEAYNRVYEQSCGSS